MSLSTLPSAGQLPETLQRLHPEAARLCLGTARFVQGELGLSLQGKSVLVAFSGGADSCAMLLVLHYLARKYDLRLTAVHLDHGLRPSSSLEAAGCLEFCRRLDLPCIVKTVDVGSTAIQTGKGIEETARECRYSFFNECLESRRADLICLGHTNNDLAEDILMRLIRGTGWPALGGMSGYDPERKLFRPLLSHSRAALEKFLSGLGVSWVEDESNQSDLYFRNRVRHSLLPLILRENPSFLSSAVNLWRMASIDRAFFNEATEDSFHQTLMSGCEAERGSPVHDFKEVGVTLVSPRTALATLPKSLRLRLFKRLLTSLGTGETPASSLFKLDQAWACAPEPTVHMMGKDITAEIRKKSIIWKKSQKSKEAQIDKPTN